MIIKTISFAVVALLVTSVGLAQDKYFTKEGKITFYSKTPVEEFDAVNSAGLSIIDTKTGAIEMSVLIKAFEFKKDLMQQHFNENYMESDKFPKAVFKGTISNIAEINFTKPGTYKAGIDGKLTMHGVTRDITVDAIFIVSIAGVIAKSEFIALLDDYNIKVPGVVKNQISQQIKVEIDNTYKPYVK
ncbi:MAG: YceI family protein [Bacteroidetes bacterium]|nr:YceI family protein [Bacteroidota bacterium]